MPYRRFLVANVAGALCWGAGLVWLGHLATRSRGSKALGYAVAATAILGSLVVAVVAWVRARRAARTPGDQPRPSSSSPKT